MSEIALLYIDDSQESRTAQAELSRCNVDFVPLLGDDSPARLPTLIVGRQVFVGLGDILLYYLRPSAARQRG